MRSYLRCSAAVAILSAACLFAGCGGQSDGVERYDLSGSVTVGGQPLSSGQIFFEPDGSAGNSGASGTAAITDGQYDTSKAEGKGVIGGPHIIRIEGRSTAGGAEVEVQWETKENFPKETTTKDFAIPAEAAKPAAPPPPPP